MKLTDEQHELLIQGLALEIEDSRQVPDHNYVTRQTSRNVVKFLSGLLLAASFGTMHEMEPVTF